MGIQQPWQTGSSPSPIGRPLLLLKPTGVGGVATTVDRLGEALARLLPTRTATVGRVPGEQVGLRAAVRGLAGMLRWAGDTPVVHVHTSLRRRAMVRDAALAAAARAMGCPVVLQVHGWDRTLVARRIRRVLGPAHAVLTVDPGLQPRLEQIRRAPVQVVCNPYDPAELPLRAPHQGVRLLFLGRLVPGKGVDTLLRACPGLSARHPGWSLQIAGDGPDRPRLQRLADDLGIRSRVRFLGWVQGAAKAACLAEATVLVHPSPEESAPLAVVEALAAGLPVVAARTGAVPALVGAAGVLLPSATAAALAWAIDEVVADPRMGAHGPEQVRACHPDRVAAHLLSIYADVSRAA